MTTYWKGCGTFLGARLHQAAGEALCADCAHREVVRRLALEGIPTRPTSEDSFPEITPERAAANRRVLAEAVSRKENQ